MFREANENFAKQHTAADTIEGVDFAYLAQNTRVNAAAAASLALAPPAPSVVNDRGANLLTRGSSGYDADLRWNASPGAVAYRIYWRDTWTNDWQHRQTIGNVTSFVLPNVSIDDFVFGVAAIGADGHESLVSAYVSPVRQSSDVMSHAADRRAILGGDAASGATEPPRCQLRARCQHQPHDAARRASEGESRRHQRMSVGGREGGRRDRTVDLHDRRSEGNELERLRWHQHLVVDADLRQRQGEFCDRAGAGVGRCTHAHCASVRLHGAAPASSARLARTR